MRLARSIAPSLPVHASTQMSITDVEGALFAESLGCDTMVVGRELSISDIAAVREGLPYVTRIEAFVHGALCVSYRSVAGETCNLFTRRTFVVV